MNLDTSGNGHAGKAVIYGRYSNRPKDAKHDRVESIEYQEEALRQYFDRLGIEVAEVIGDPLTSARLVPLKERPGGKRLLALTTGRRPRYSIVGAYRLDRLFRDIVDGVQVLRAWKRSKAALHLSAEGGQSLNTASAFGRCMVHTRLVYAEFEADLTSERTQSAMLRMQRNGKLMSKQPPFGWRVEPENPRALLPDQIEQNVLQLVKAWSDKGYTPAQISTMLNKQGILWRSKPCHQEKVRRALRRLSRSAGT
jgi:DNA invertase Pin-like site-specific DNA recombinase